MGQCGHLRGFLEACFQKHALYTNIWSRSRSWSRNGLRGHQQPPHHSLVNTSYHLERQMLHDHIYMRNLIKQTHSCPGLEGGGAREVMVKGAKPQLHWACLQFCSWLCSPHQGAQIMLDRICWGGGAARKHRQARQGSPAASQAHPVRAVPAGQAQPCCTAGLLRGQCQGGYLRLCEECY